MNYQQGSEWRKWDLHVHTPESLENHYSGKDKEEKWERFLDDLEALPADVKVLGINDYLFIDGYRKLLAYKKDGRIQNIDTIFPVIEFRIKKFAGHKDFKRINFHVIFSNELTPDTIQNQFLNSLQGKYSLTPGIERVEWNAAVTIESLEDLGKKIKESVPAELLQNYGTDLIEGFNNLNLDEEEIIRLLSSNTYLRNNYLLAIGKTEWESLSWGEASIAEKKDIINKVDFVFISSENPPAYENAKKKLIQQSVNSCLLDCSDAHYYSSSENKDRIGKCFTWIKADTTFEGLRQVTLEFNDRVFVGDTPQSKEIVENSPTKFINSLEIRKINNSTMPEIWFEDMPKLTLNKGLVAIIGNKGNGKSAISDIIGLLGNSHNYNDFSFLNNNKFLKRKPYCRADAFEARLSWCSGMNTNFMTLSSNIDESLSEKVKYLPQNFLEKICSEDLESDGFEKELKIVVFSHMDDTQKLGTSSFDNYIQFRTSEINKKIARQKTSLQEINKQIFTLELKTKPSYLKGLEDKQKVKEDELEAHKKTKPEKVNQPDADNELKQKQEEISKKLEVLQKDKISLQESIEIEKQKKHEFNLLIADLDSFLQGIGDLEDYLTDFNTRFNEKLAKYDIDIKEVLSYKITKTKVVSKIDSAKKEIKLIDDKLDLLKEGSLLFQVSVIDNKVKEYKVQLSEPFRLYQKYLEQVEKWNKREKEIIGSKSTEDTIEFYKEQIRYLNEELINDLAKLKQSRISIFQDIYKAKQEIIALYKDAYHPVTDLIQENRDVMEDYNIEFDASLRLNNFPSKFFNLINQGSKGSFSGKQEGYNILQNILEESSYSTIEECQTFIELIIQKLKTDERDGRNKEIRFVDEQLRKDYTPTDFYDFIFGLDYLDATYQLKLSGKELSELSPGERGALLLIFYLLLDKGDIPLIIDQPEENLDNQSVYNILVKFIKKAKARRQVIIVTHNPNLAVVCDAEQLIRVHIEKENKNKVTFISGAIENKLINDEIVKILEGTKPAFTNRKLKYENVNK